MNEEEKKLFEAIKYKNKHLFLVKVDADFLINLIEKQQKELNRLKEIEQQHKVDNGLLRQELDMQIEHNKELEEKLKIATAMLTKGTYPADNDKDNDFDCQFVSKDKVKIQIEQLKFMNVGGEVFTTAVSFAIKILESLLED